MKPLLFVILVCAQSLAQFSVTDINTFHTDSHIINCTDTHQSISDPGWEYNCDFGSGNCTGSAGPVCGNIPTNTVSTAGTCPVPPDLQARELEVSWTGSLDGGVNFHPSINSTSNGNLDTTDYDWTWGGWFCYTDLTNIWRIEFDFNQIVTSNDILILAAQCNLSVNKWQFQNGWGLTSDIPCNKTSEFTANVWHQIVIHATRCATFTHGSACATVYKSVAVDGVTTNCTTNCNSTTSEDAQSWTPVGGIIENVQYDPHTSGTGSMTAYADLMTTHSGPPTTAATPTFSPTGGTYSGTQNVTISTATGGATICYTLDGSTPQGNGGGTCVSPALTYGSPVVVSSSETINAIATEDGVDFDSAQGSASYTINGLGGSAFAGATLKGSTVQ